jgi:hypothetical protein
MAKAAGLIPEGRHIHVKIQQFAQDLHSPISTAVQRGWIAFQSRTRQCSPFVERLIEDELGFALNAVDLRIQFGRQIPGG